MICENGIKVRIYGNAYLRNTKPEWGKGNKEKKLYFYHLVSFHNVKIHISGKRFRK